MPLVLLPLALLGLSLPGAHADTDTATVNGVQVPAASKAAPKKAEPSEAEGQPASERRDSAFPYFHQRTTQSPGGWGGGQGSSPDAHWGGRKTTQSPYGGWNGGGHSHYDPNSIFHSSTKPPWVKYAGLATAGVVGTGAVAGVIAVSVMQAKKNKQGMLSKQATAPTAAPQVSGGMTLSVPNAGTFMSDTAAQNAVAQGIADEAGVDPKYVHITSVQGANPRRARRLADSVSVAYTIDVPPASDPDTVNAALTGNPLSHIAAQVQSRVSAAKGPGFSVAVTQHDVQPALGAIAARQAMPQIASKSLAHGGAPSLTAAPSKGFLPTSAPTVAPQAPAPATTIPQLSSGSTEGQVIALACGLVTCGCCLICLAALASFFCRKKKGASRRPTRDVAPAEFEDYPDQQPLMEQRQGASMQVPASSPDMFSQQAAQPPTQMNVGAGGNVWAQASVPTLHDVVPMQTVPPPPMYGSPPATNFFPSASPLANTQPATGFLGQSYPTAGTIPQLPPTIYG